MGARGAYVSLWVLKRRTAFFSPSSKMLFKGSEAVNRTFFGFCDRNEIERQGVVIYQINHCYGSIYWRLK